ncbi:MAG: hypothetical protein IKK57_13140 [Clostridia bacterium]|nr:hypothetical protein [Clostridia bacterium]
MKRMRDERAVRGAAEEAAKMYWWAVGVLALLLGIKLLMVAKLESHLLILLVEAVTLLLGIGSVLAQRVCLGLWRHMDDALSELLIRARARAFGLMGPVSVVMMVVGYILDFEAYFWYSTPALAISLMRSHVGSRCVKAGWLHGLQRRPPRGKKAIVPGLLSAAAFVCFMLLVHWLKERCAPDAFTMSITLIFAAVIFLTWVLGTRKEFDESEWVAEVKLRAAERMAEREEPDEE